jgi:hypothetical protein
MRLLNGRVALGDCNLGSVEQLEGLTAAIEVINHDLGESNLVWSRDDLREFRRTLDKLGEVMMRLRGAVRVRIGALTGGHLDAG